MSARALARTAIPGLYFSQNFHTVSEQERLLKIAFALHNTIVSQPVGEEQVHISKNHNLPEERTYRLLKWKEDGQILNPQYFESYGEVGHSLAYFRSQPGIPPVITTELVPRIQELGPVRSLKLKEPLAWNFTFNVYRPSHSNPDTVAAFPFHVDIPENGEFTSITNVKGEARFEIKREDGPSFEFHLTPGSLLLLTGEARWDWKHRILPMPIQDCKSSIQRISMVLGAN